MGEDFEGVLAFDEAHAMQNAAGSVEGRGVKPSQQGLAGLRLQLAAPRARVFYISATGATSVHNLAYAARLGLWGQGPEYPFPSRESFVSAMEAGGVAAMEVVARDLKTLGLYTARALSFDGVEYDVLEHALTPAQIEIYDAYAGAFRTIHHNLEAALTATGVNDASGETNASAARASAKSRFESTKQRFFNHLLMGMKTPTIIRAIKDDLAAGNACVIQVVSTGESLLKRRLETMDPEDELVEGALTPRDYVLGYLEQAFPIHAQKLVDIDGNMVTEPLRDETGALVVSREALALRDAAMMELMTLAPIPSALDQILWALGDEAVAEVTGRSVRPLKAEDGHLFIEKRAASSNSSETQAFMDGEKDILIFSDAGGTGRSYHAAQTAKNQKRRRHYLLEPGWRADAAIQGLGPHASLGSGQRALLPGLHLGCAWREAFHLDYSQTPRPAGGLDQGSARDRLAGHVPRGGQSRKPDRTGGAAWVFRRSCRRAGRGDELRELHRLDGPAADRQGRGAARRAAADPAVSQPGAGPARSTCRTRSLPSSCAGLPIRLNGRARQARSISAWKPCAAKRSSRSPPRISGPARNPAR